MVKEYYVYPNGTSIAVAGNNEYATQIPMSANDATDVYTAINANAKKTVVCTQAQFDAWDSTTPKSFPYTDCPYIITDAPALQYSAADLSYDGGVTSTHDVIASKADSSSLATVATSGSYNDLSNLPDLSTKQNNISGGSIKNIDFNTLTDTKTYWVNNEGLVNAPVNTYGYLEVFAQSNSLILQRYTTYGSYTVYVRYYVNGQWYGWNKIGGPNDILINYGEISQSGVLSSVGTYMKNNYQGNRWVQARFKPTDSTGYWGTSSITAMWNLSSANYGVAILMTDNTSKNSVIYGQLAGGTWSFKTPTLTTVT
jgi:hypothetical protein